MKLPVNSSTLICAVILLLTLAPRANAADRQAEGLAMLQRAAALADLHDSGPYRLRYEVTVKGLEKANGTILILHLSENRWRREIHFPGFDSVEVVDGGRMWRTRNLPFLPPVLRSVIPEMEIDLKASLKEGKVISLSRRKQDGVSTLCVTVERDRVKTPWCFFADSGLPASNDDNGRNEYSDYIALGTKQIARTIRMYRKGFLTAEAHLQESGIDVPDDPPLYSAPPGSTELPWCADMKHAEAVYNPDPHLPERLVGRRGVAYTTMFELTIGANGVVEQVVPITNNPELDKLAIEALRSWRFKPATCSGTPGQSEILFELNMSTY